jgi:hypothetical protein
MMRRLFQGIAVCLTAGLITVAVQAQGAGRGEAAAGPKNLQVLPQDFTQQQVLQVMQMFTASLGVNCAYCHVFFGGNNPMTDMASDMKPQKRIAREMLRMANDINARLATVVQKSDTERVRVECMTCHRGTAIPSSPGPIARTP